MISSKSYKAIGEDIWKSQVPKISSELFTLTYGSLVAQLIKDYEDFDQVNKQLELMYAFRLLFSSRLHSVVSGTTWL